MKKTILFFIGLVLLGLFVACSSDKTPRLNSSEYKLLLNRDYFDDYKAGFENYWNIVKTVAENNNITVIENDHPYKLKHKEVSFYDTENFDLRKAGFLIRQKVKYKNEHKKPGFEFGVKYRRSNPKDALSVDLTLSEGYTPKYDKIELESDVVYYSISNGNRDIKYSVSNSIKLKEAPEMTLGSFAKIYPTLANLDLPLSAPLLKVAGVSADEWMVLPGKLDFGDGLFGRVDITIWIIQTKTGELRIPEFSFDHPFFEDKNYDDVAMKRCADFIDKLYDFQTDWTSPGALKAAFLFGDVK